MILGKYCKHLSHLPQIYMYMCHVDLIYRFEEAAEKGISRAIEAGSKKPLLFFQNPKEKQFPNAGACSLLGALKAAYVPIEVRISMRQS